MHFAQWQYFQCDAKENEKVPYTPSALSATEVNGVSAFARLTCRYNQRESRAANERNASQ